MAHTSTGDCFCTETIFFIRDSQVLESRRTAVCTCNIHGNFILLAAFKRDFWFYIELDMPIIARLCDGNASAVLSSFCAFVGFKDIINRLRRNAAILIDYFFNFKTTYSNIGSSRNVADLQDDFQFTTYIRLDRVIDLSAGDRLFAEAFFSFYGQILEDHSIAVCTGNIHCDTICLSCLKLYVRLYIEFDMPIITRSNDFCRCTASVA